LTLCPHFGTCGGCSLQDLPPDEYRAKKRQAVIDALARAGVAAEVQGPVIVPPRTRRRAVFKIKSVAEGLHIGFHAAKSHTVIDMNHCDVLTPGLFALVGALRQRLEKLFGVGEAAELHVTETETGFDAALRWRAALTPALTAELTQALLPRARSAGGGGVSERASAKETEGETNIARLTMGRDTVFETATPTVTLGGVEVALPSNPFLQSTAEGEAALQARVVEILGKAKQVADLFAGVGTFALPLARKAKVHAVEQDAPALAALSAAARMANGLKPVTTETRDLFRQPLTALELKPYDALVLDPPRAGAEAQARVLAAAKNGPGTIAYVSCDAASFARDAAILAAGGWRPGPVTPIDQFLWSSHIELVGGFSRGRV
jgi:23S rRNA (uracil1939-C5)-methyltransferase